MLLAPPSPSIFTSASSASPTIVPSTPPPLYIHLHLLFSTLSLHTSSSHLRWHRVVFVRDTEDSRALPLARRLKGCGRHNAGWSMLLRAGFQEAWGMQGVGVELVSCLPGA
eukprot:365729-Chlamydomonas_euryale.AAC.6